MKKVSKCFADSVIFPIFATIIIKDIKIMDNQFDAKNIIQMAQNSKDALIELYNNSSPEERNLILKIIGGVAGLAVFFSYLKSLGTPQK